MAGSIETKAISASNLKLKLKLTEAELGKIEFLHERSALQSLAVRRLTGNDDIGLLFSPFFSIFLLILAQAGSVPEVIVRAVDCWQ